MIVTGDVMERRCNRGNGNIGGESRWRGRIEESAGGKIGLILIPALPSPIKV